MVGPAVKREAVAHLRTMFQMSERRACSVIAADRTSIRYQFCRPPDTELRCRLRDLANARRRFGYRRRPGFSAAGEPANCNGYPLFLRSRRANFARNFNSLS